MNAKATDVHRTLEYGSTVITTLIWIPLVALVLGLLSLVYPTPETIIPGWLCLSIGAGWLAYALFRQFKTEKPLLVLSPDGILYRNVSDNLIPWQEILNITTTELTDRSGAVKQTFKNITVIWVSRRFHETAVLPGAPLWRRTPGWEGNFIPKGPQIGILILHGLLSVPSAPLRAEIEARWRAFKERPRGLVSPSAQTGKPASAGVALAVSLALGIVAAFAIAAMAITRAGLWPDNAPDNSYWRELQKRNVDPDRVWQREFGRTEEKIK